MGYEPNANRFSCFKSEVMRKLMLELDAKFVELEKANEKAQKYDAIKHLITFPTETDP